jgi:hypothetical protein
VIKPISDPIVRAAFGSKLDRFETSKLGRPKG